MLPGPLPCRSQLTLRRAPFQYSSLDEASSVTSRFRCRPLSKPGHETVNEANVSVGLSTIPHLANSPVGYFRRQPAAARIQNRNSDVVDQTFVVGADKVDSAVLGIPNHRFSREWVFEPRVGFLHESGDILVADARVEHLHDERSQPQSSVDDVHLLKHRGGFQLPANVPREKDPAERIDEILPAK